MTVFWKHDELVEPSPVQTWIANALRHVGQSIAAELGRLVSAKSEVDKARSAAACVNLERPPFPPIPPMVPGGMPVVAAVTEARLHPGERVIVLPTQPAQVRPAAGHTGFVHGVTNQPAGHPWWDDGEPIRWGDYVRTPEGWSGIVSGIRADELEVSPGEGLEELFSPEQLILIDHDSVPEWVQR